MADEKIIVEINGVEHELFDLVESIQDKQEEDELKELEKKEDE